MITTSMMRFIFKKNGSSVSLTVPNLDHFKLRTSIHMVQYVFKISTFVALNPMFETVCTIWEASATYIYWALLINNPFLLNYAFILELEAEYNIIRPEVHRS
jgi:hypothetical protein